MLLQVNAFSYLTYNICESVLGHGGGGDENPLPPLVVSTVLS